jgi:hypothetical protein
VKSSSSSSSSSSSGYAEALESPGGGIRKFWNGGYSKGVQSRLFSKPG